MNDEYGHEHDHPSHRQGKEDSSTEGRKASNRQRVAREAEKHRDPAEDPADKEAAEQRHSAARYRVLAADYAGQDEADPEAVAQQLKSEQEQSQAEADEKQRKKKERVQQKR